MAAHGSWLCPRASFEGFDVGGFLLGGSMNCREGVIDLPAPRGAWC